MEIKCKNYIEIKQNNQNKLFPGEKILKIVRKGHLQSVKTNGSSQLSFFDV